MELRIVCDSSCELFKLDKEVKELEFTTVPFIISCGEKDFIDDDKLDIKAMLDTMETTEEASRTSCPTSNSWYEEFKKPGDVIAITISSNLSGSYNSALSAKEMVLEEEPNKKILLVDSKSTGPGCILIIEKIAELKEKGCSFEQIALEIEKIVSNSKTIFTLCSFSNLIKNGRMNRIAGLIAGRLKIWGVGIASDIGTIKIKGVVPGRKRAIKAIVEDIEKRLPDATRVIISHCENEEVANELKQAILDTYPNIQVSVYPCRGLCSYYAEKNGLIVSYR